MRIKDRINGEWNDHLMYLGGDQVFRTLCVGGYKSRQTLKLVYEN